MKTLESGYEGREVYKDERETRLTDFKFSKDMCASHSATHSTGPTHGESANGRQLA